jgi:proteasome lid subunit RPN8/RPN11
VKKTKNHDDEILHQLRHYESEYKETKKGHILHSLIKLFVAILLLFLIAFYSDAIFRMFYVAEGKNASSLISEDNVISLNGFNVTFDKLTYKQLLAIYDSSNGNEIKVCLLGSYDYGNYYVTALYIPEIFSQSGIHVVSESCDENTIISLHSHPVDNCFFSKEDISSYQKFKMINPNALIGLMCSKKRFNFYKD